MKLENYLVENWQKYLEKQFRKEYFRDLKRFLRAERKKNTIYPDQENTFLAFNLTSPQKVKVVILGQDPYHGQGQAHGLAFSVPEGIKKPPSLRNIFKELNNDIGKDIPESGDLTHWAKQDVLLLNAILTVRAGKPSSHRKKGWEIFTNNVIQQLSDDRKGLVFLLWGNFARQKQSIIDTSKHHVLTASHPSPFSAHQGFFGCRHFSTTNKIVKKYGKQPVNW